MKRLLAFIFILLPVLLSAAPPPSAAKINVFACEPEWAALAKEIGRGKVKVFSATHAAQNPHYIRARPSLISKIRKADILICSGASLEVGWLPPLLQKAGKNVQPGEPGHLMAADFVETLEKPQILDRAMGDVHPQGNPHVHLNPHNILLVADELAARLSVFDRENAKTYEENHRGFSGRWKEAISAWEARAAPFRGKSFIVHHKSWSYLADWLKLSISGALEPKPGIPPSGTHLRSLLAEVRAGPVSAIIRTPYDPDAASAWLSRKTGVPAAVLPYTVGGAENTDDLFSLFDRTIEILEELIDSER